MRDGLVRRYVAVVALALAAAGCAVDAANDHAQEVADSGVSQSIFETTTMDPVVGTVATTIATTGAVTGAVTVTTHPWPPESALMASEVVVGLAISRFAPAWENCHAGYRYVPVSEYIGHDQGTGQAEDLHAGHRTVEFVCELRVDFNKADGDEFGVTMELVVRYPLRAVVDELDAEINGHVRNAAAAMVSDYFTTVRDRVGPQDLTDAPHNTLHRNGWLRIYGAATLANDGIWSVRLRSAAHDPLFNTAQNYVRTLNYDLHTGQQFFLTDLVEDRVDARIALFRAVDEANPDRDFSAWQGDVDPEDLREQEFSLTEESIVLRCTWYCDSGMAPMLFYKRRSTIEVPYGRLEGHFDPDGPYRHIDDPFDP